MWQARSKGRVILSMYKPLGCFDTYKLSGMLSYRSTMYRTTADTSEDLLSHTAGSHACQYPFCQSDGCLSSPFGTQQVPVIVRVGLGLQDDRLDDAISLFSQCLETRVNIFGGE